MLLFVEIKSKLFFCCLNSLDCILTASMICEILPNVLWLPRSEGLRNLVINVQELIIFPMLVCCVHQGTASVVSGTPSVLLSSMNTDMVCERLRVMEGIDQGMLAQYTATIKKVCS